MAINTPNTKLQSGQNPRDDGADCCGDYEMGKSPNTRGAPGWDRGNAMTGAGGSGLKMRAGGTQDSGETTTGLAASAPQD